MKSDSIFWRILERIENPLFSPISNGEILGSIYWVKISTIFLHSIISLAIKEKGHSFRYSSYPCWFMSRKFSPNFEGSLNLGFGVFSFYTLHFERFRASKRWAKSASFFSDILWWNYWFKESSWKLIEFFFTQKWVSKLTFSL